MNNATRLAALAQLAARQRAAAEQNARDEAAQRPAQ